MRLISVKDYAAAAGVTHQAVYKRLKNGNLQGEKVGNKLYISVPDDFKGLTTFETGFATRLNHEENAENTGKTQESNTSSNNADSTRFNNSESTDSTPQIVPIDYPKLVAYLMTQLQEKDKQIEELHRLLDHQQQLTLRQQSKGLLGWFKGLIGHSDTVIDVEEKKAE